PPRRRLPGLQPGRGHPQAGHRAGAAGPPARDDRARRRNRARGGHRTVLLPGETVTAQPRVLLLVPARTYRAADFILAAERMRLDLVVASDGALPLGGRPVIPVSPANPGASARRILARAGRVDAVVAADTPMLVLAATVAARMGLPHNPVGAMRAGTDKAAQRQR